MAGLVDGVGDLAPVGGLVGHEANTLEEVDGAAGGAEEDVGAVAKLGSFKDDGLAAVLEDAADEGAVAELFSVDADGLIFDQQTFNKLHSAPSVLHEAS